MPPFCVNFVALLSRFSRIWFRRSWLQRITEIPLCYEICKKIACKTKYKANTYLIILDTDKIYQRLCKRKVKRMNDASENRFCSGMEMGNKEK